MDDPKWVHDVGIYQACESMVYLSINLKKTSKETKAYCSNFQELDVTILPGVGIPDLPVLACTRSIVSSSWNFEGESHGFSVHLLNAHLCLDEC